MVCIVAYALNKKFGLVTAPLVVEDKEVVTVFYKNVSSKGIRQDTGTLG